MTARAEEAKKIVFDTITKRLLERRQLLQVAIESFQGNTEALQQIKDGKSPKTKETSPLTDQEREIVYKIILNSAPEVA